MAKPSAILEQFDPLLLVSTDKLRSWLAEFKKACENTTNTELWIAQGIAENDKQLPSEVVTIINGELDRLGPNLDTLPYELQLQIFDTLSPRDLINLSANRRLRDISSGDDLWGKFLAPEMQKTNCKELFMTDLTSRAAQYREVDEAGKMFNKLQRQIDFSLWRPASPAFYAVLAQAEKKHGSDGINSLLYALSQDNAKLLRENSEFLDKLGQATIKDGFRNAAACINSLRKDGSAELRSSSLFMHTIGNAIANHGSYGASELIGKCSKDGFDSRWYRIDEDGFPPTSEQMRARAAARAAIKPLTKEDPWRSDVINRLSAKAEQYHTEADKERSKINYQHRFIGKLFNAQYEQQLRVKSAKAMALERLILDIKKNLKSSVSDVIESFKKSDVGKKAMLGFFSHELKTLLDTIEKEDPQKKAPPPKSPRP